MYTTQLFYRGDTYIVQRGYDSLRDIIFETQIADTDG